MKCSDIVAKTGRLNDFKSLKTLCPYHFNVKKVCNTVDKLYACQISGFWSNRVKSNPLFSEECLNASFMLGWKFKILIAIYILQAKQKILCYVLWRKLQILRNELKINEGKKQHKNCKPCGSQIIPSSKLIICVHTVIGADRYLCHPLSKELR